MHRTRILLFALAVNLFITPLYASSTDEIAGRWEGEIALPNGRLQVMVDLEENDGAWSGTVDIPQQGAEDLPLAVELDGDTITMEIEGIPGTPTFRGAIEDEMLKGTFTQGAAILPFELGRDAIAPPNRPQEPKPPYPYDEEEVTFSHGDITLAGTLTLPREEGPHPAVAMITGSGPQDRDEALFDHKPFKVIADHLTRRGIAVLRYDDRGFGESTGDFATATSEDFTDDALAAVAFLRERDEIDKRRIGLIGHSEGGIIGPMAASRSDQVKFVVMLAGPGVPGEDILRLQLELLARAGGMTQAMIDKNLEMQAEAFTLMREEKDEAKLEAAMLELARRQIEFAGGFETEEEIEAAAQAAVAQTLSPWFRFFTDYDPRTALRNVDVPVLALWGGRDLQVDARQSLAEVGKALFEAGNLDVTLRTFPKANHLFQTATTGAVTEYATIEETMDPDVLDAIGFWIESRYVD
ncbi:MAG: alpha/beta fold hydrolase [Acidobacteriota bacterium]